VGPVSEHHIDGLICRDDGTSLCRIERAYERFSPDSGRLDGFTGQSDRVAV